jgi:GNAT superfamily N-acetyltransferase
MVMNPELKPLPPGQVGAIVTFLEMNERPVPSAIPASTLRLERWHRVDPDRYRSLFRRVGAKWLWFSRLAMDDATLMETVAEVHAVVDESDREVGLLELDFRAPGQCLIRFLGLVPELSGRGHGRWLFAQTLDLAWREGIEIVRVHTCSLDHPAALPAYLRAGFRARSRAFESFPDPRLTGVLPRDAAPQLPLVEAPAR